MSESHPVSESQKVVIDLLRHGQPEGGEVLRGQVNPPLTENGYQQMQQALSLSNGSEPPWTEIVSSSLIRCSRFAEVLAQRHDLPLAVDEQWQEMGFGEWDGVDREILWRDYEEELTLFRTDPLQFTAPGGEPFVDFKQRILKAWQGLVQKPDGSHILLLTHGGIFRIVLPAILQIQAHGTNHFQIPYACFSRIEIYRQQGKILSSLVFHNNSASHL